MKTCKKFQKQRQLSNENMSQIPNFYFLAKSWVLTLAAQSRYETCGQVSLIVIIQTKFHLKVTNSICELPYQRDNPLSTCFPTHKMGWGSVCVGGGAGDDL